MGVGLNTMLAALGTAGVAASKVGAAVDQKVGRDEAAKEKKKNEAIDEAKMNFQLEDTQREHDAIQKEQTQNFFEQGLARSEGKMDNLQALQKAREALNSEAEANEIRQNQIKTIMKLKGYGGKK